MCSPLGRDLPQQFSGEAETGEANRLRGSRAMSPYPKRYARPRLPEQPFCQIFAILCTNTPTDPQKNPRIPALFRVLVLPARGSLCALHASGFEFEARRPFLFGLAAARANLESCSMSDLGRQCRFARAPLPGNSHQRTPETMNAKTLSTAVANPHHPFCPRSL